MVVPNFVFDLLLFGLLLAAGAVDGAFPVLQGALTLLWAGGLTYWAAQELSEALLRRAGWSQESLATSVALCVGGFVYFWSRNQSDFALLVLSIGLMMASLMLALSIMAAVGAALRVGRPAPIAGWFACFFGSAMLGLLAGTLALALGAPATPSALLYKAAAVGVALVLWKWREKSSPPESNPHFQALEAQKTAGLAPALPTPRFTFFPHRGTLLDRLLPLLLTGLVLLMALHQGFGGSGAFRPAQAAATGSASPAPALPGS